jgi:hypothetical protein
MDSLRYPLVPAACVAMTLPLEPALGARVCRRWPESMADVGREQEQAEHG